MKEKVIQVDIPDFVTQVGKGIFQGIESSLKVTYIGTGLKGVAGMFYGYEGEQLDLSEFNTNSIEDMTAMFMGCHQIKVLDLRHFNTQNVTSMRDMFNNCFGLKHLYIGSFNTSNVKSMVRMFSSCG